LRNPSIADDEMTSEQVKIQELTEEITNMFNHARRLIRFVNYFLKFYADVLS